MSTLDGNAIASTLYDVFGREMTAAVGTCAGCSWTGRLAELAVFLLQPGVVARCPRCDHLMLVVVERHGMSCLDMAGFASLPQEPSP